MVDSAQWLRFSTVLWLVLQGGHLVQAHISKATSQHVRLLIYRHVEVGKPQTLDYYRREMDQYVDHMAYRQVEERRTREEHEASSNVDSLFRQRQVKRRVHENPRRENSRQQPANRPQSASEKMQRAQPVERVERVDRLDKATSRRADATRQPECQEARSNDIRRVVQDMTRREAEAERDVGRRVNRVVDMLRVEQDITRRKEQVERVFNRRRERVADMGRVDNTKRKELEEQKERDVSRRKDRVADMRHVERDITEKVDRLEQSEPKMGRCASRREGRAAYMKRVERDIAQCEEHGDRAGRGERTVDHSTSRRGEGAPDMRRAEKDISRSEEREDRVERNASHRKDCLADMQRVERDIIRRKVREDHVERAERIVEGHNSRIKEQAANMRRFNGEITQREEQEDRVKRNKRTLQRDASRREKRAANMRRVERDITQQKKHTSRAVRPIAIKEKRMNPESSHATERGVIRRQERAVSWRQRRKGSRVGRVDIQRQESEGDRNLHRECRQRHEQDAYRIADTICLEELRCVERDKIRRQELVEQERRQTELQEQNRPVREQRISESREMKRQDVRETRQYDRETRNEVQTLDFGQQLQEKRRDSRLDNHWADRVGRQEHFDRLDSRREMPVDREECNKRLYERLNSKRLEDVERQRVLRAERFERNEQAERKRVERVEHLGNNKRLDSQKADCAKCQESIVHHDERVDIRTEESKCRQHNKWGEHRVERSADQRHELLRRVNFQRAETHPLERRSEVNIFIPQREPARRAETPSEERRERLENRRVTVHNARREMRVEHEQCVELKPVYWSGYFKREFIIAVQALLLALVYAKSRGNSKALSLSNLLGERIYGYLHAISC